MPKFEGRKKFPEIFLRNSGKSEKNFTKFFEWSKKFGAAKIFLKRFPCKIVVHG
jgi:hypothetical protein